MDYVSNSNSTLISDIIHRNISETCTQALGYKYKKNVGLYSVHNIAKKSERIRMGIWLQSEINFTGVG